MNTESLEKGTQQNNSAPKRTQISEIGKVALLKRLFEGTKYNNPTSQMYRYTFTSGKRCLTLKTTSLEAMNITIEYIFCLVVMTNS